MGAGDLQRRLDAIFDPGGEMAEFARVLELLAGPDGKVLGVDTTSFMESFRRGKTHTSIAARAIELFGPLGWAPSNQMPVDAYEKALASLLVDGDVERAEGILTDCWDLDYRLRRPIGQVSVLAADDPELDPLFKARSRLLYKAKEHHDAGRYEASIPILLAQVEGIVADTSGGKMFFSKSDRKKAEIIEARSIATLSEALPVVREALSSNMDYSAAEGSIRRHGIMHGRELAYDTRTNSVKCFVLLQAIVEWAQPVARELVEHRKAEREARWAGSEETDEDGRRRDRREFLSTRLALRNLATSQMGWYRQENRYRQDLLEKLGPRFTKDGLPHNHGIVLHVSADGQEWWAYRRTVTGWCFGIGASGPPPHQVLYEGAEPPQGGPTTDGWADRFEYPPNWE